MNFLCVEKHPQLQFGGANHFNSSSPSVNIAMCLAWVGRLSRIRSFIGSHLEAFVCLYSWLGIKFLGHAFFHWQLGVLLTTFFQHIEYHDTRQRDEGWQTGVSSSWRF